MKPTAVVWQFGRFDCPHSAVGMDPSSPLRRTLETMDALTALPRFRDSWSYVYLEKGVIDREHASIAFHSAESSIPLPVASLSTLMLGPGTSITHAAVRTLAESNCLVIWCGDESVRFYATGTGATGHSQNLIRQAALVSDPATRLAVCRTMYAKRFAEPPEDGVTIEQLRGFEGQRVRQAYADASRRFGLRWEGRNYDQAQWRRSRPRQSRTFGCQRLPLRIGPCCDRFRRIQPGTRLYPRR